MPSRTRVLARLAVAAAGLLVLGLAVAACPQQEGERCQRDQDCADGLKCNQGTQLCQVGVSGTMDASIDVAIDAEIDATVDAAVDAAPTAR